MSIMRLCTWFPAMMVNASNSGGTSSRSPSSRREGALVICYLYLLWCGGRCCSGRMGRRWREVPSPWPSPTWARLLSAPYPWLEVSRWQKGSSGRRCHGGRRGRRRREVPLPGRPQPELVSCPASQPFLAVAGSSQNRASECSGDWLQWTVTVSFAVAMIEVQPSEFLSLYCIDTLSVYKYCSTMIFVCFCTISCLENSIANQVVFLTNGCLNDITCLLNSRNWMLVLAK
jgi:hypothetical protein